jgi:hypothetical protein
MPYRHSFSGSTEVDQRRFQIYLALCQLIDPLMLEVNPALNLHHEVPSFTDKTSRTAEFFALGLDLAIQAQAVNLPDQLDPLHGFVLRKCKLFTSRRRSGRPKCGPQFIRAWELLPGDEDGRFLCRRLHLGTSRRNSVAAGAVVPNAPAVPPPHIPVIVVNDSDSDSDPEPPVIAAASPQGGLTVICFFF